MSNNFFYFMMYNKCSMGTPTNKTQNASDQSTINLSVIMTRHYPKYFAILHVVGGVVNLKKKKKKKTLFLQEHDRKHEPSNGHIKHEAV